MTSDIEALFLWPKYDGDAFKITSFVITYVFAYLRRMVSKIFILNVQAIIDSRKY